MGKYIAALADTHQILDDLLRKRVLDQTTNVAQSLEVFHVSHEFRGKRIGSTAPRIFFQEASDGADRIAYT